MGFPQKNSWEVPGMYLPDETERKKRMKSVEQFTQKEIEMMEFRERLFLEQVEQYRAAVTGEQESILPFVRDENGVYSEEKTWEF